MGISIRLFSIDERVLLQHINYFKKHKEFSEIHPVSHPVNILLVKNYLDGKMNYDEFIKKQNEFKLPGCSLIFSSDSHTESEYFNIILNILREKKKNYDKLLYDFSGKPTIEKTDVDLVKVSKFSADAFFEMTASKVEISHTSGYLLYEDFDKHIDVKSFLSDFESIPKKYFVEEIIKRSHKYKKEISKEDFELIQEPIFKFYDNFYGAIKDAVKNKRAIACHCSW